MKMFALILTLLTAICSSVEAHVTGDTVFASSGFGVRAGAYRAFPSYMDDILKSQLDPVGMRSSGFATSYHLRYGFSLFRDRKEGKSLAESWQGAGVAVNSFGNRGGIGVPVSLYVWQGAPVWRFTDRVTLYYEWNFGASFGWHPCDGFTARSNLIVGSKTNAYINLGAGVRWNTGGRLEMSAGLDLTHYSNGNTSFPNPGVNLVGVRVGITHLSKRKECDAWVKKICEPEDTASRRKYPEFDLTLYGAWRKRVYRGGDTPVLLNGHFGVAGIDFAPMWRVSRHFRAGVSADFQWDGSTNLKKYHVSGDTSETISFGRPPVMSQVCVGLSGRAELVMPVFSVNVGIGYNVAGPPETRASYQLANLKLRLTEALFLNIGYQLQNFQKQSNLMLGAGYCF